MKKILLLAILGIAAASESYGAGHIYIWNYATAPYNQVLWSAGFPGAQAINDPNVQIQVWYAEGNVSDDSLLTPGAIGFIEPGYAYDAGYGPGGYFNRIYQALPQWDFGDVYTFQLRSPDYPGRSVLWTEQSEIISSSDFPPLPPHYSSTVPQLVLVPEPSSFALASVAAFAWLIPWRRNRAALNS
jgi:hypothetical protein